jgi:hypothetical protein
MTTWDNACSCCGHDVLWWRSRSGDQVCVRCAADPLAALEILARRGRPGLVKEVQSCCLQDPMHRRRLSDMHGQGEGIAV